MSETREEIRKELADRLTTAFVLGSFGNHRERVEDILDLLDAYLAASRSPTPSHSIEGAER